MPCDVPLQVSAYYTKDARKTAPLNQTCGSLFSRDGDALAALLAFAQLMVVL